MSTPNTPDASVTPAQRIIDARHEAEALIEAALRRLHRDTGAKPAAILVNCATTPLGDFACKATIKIALD